VVSSFDPNLIPHPLFPERLIIPAVAGDISIPSGPLVIRNLSVHGWPSGHALDSEEAIAFALLKGVECQVQTWPLDKAPEAYEAMMSGNVRGRAVITMG
jgi:D-arabinose 1-dehydrogenase-like Zn-dependent alcohol dehydrogenase